MKIHAFIYSQTSNAAHFLAIFAVFALLSAVAAADEAPTLSVQHAHEMASQGEILLIDVRRPEEWADTGVGESAHAVSMHLPGFAEKLSVLTGGDMGHPIALICARGARSSYMQRELTALGYSSVLNVAEGMLGSRAGPGWLASGLPVSARAE